MRKNFVFLVPINKLHIVCTINLEIERQDRLWKWTMYTGQMHRDARLQMREKLHCRWCTVVGRSRFVAVPRVLCGNLACAHAPNFYAWTHFPRFLVRAFRENVRVTRKFIITAARR